MSTAKENEVGADAATLDDEAEHLRTPTWVRGRVAELIAQEMNSDELSTTSSADLQGVANQARSERDLCGQSWWLTALLAHDRNFIVKKVLVDQDSSTDILFYTTFEKMQLTEASLIPYKGDLVVFSRKRVDVRGAI
ncbi:hypothetical protein Cni_G16397 [Canna indica]|uniref:Uncharacterized protein n=1 Tax=Canna indica TaxID=4628 RepID=A0AAQ3KKI8_9LILI|nr:hypothetical protein Cni_G16397 [Canna indica]